MRLAGLAPAGLRRALRPRRGPPALNGPRLLARFAERHPDASFVEIGANDGVQHDHLRPHLLARRWRGVMVEPVPNVFARLEENYAAFRDRITLENAAIADRDGRLPFFHLAPAAAAERAALPDWYDGIGSFSRAAVERHARHIPDLEHRVVCTELPCLTFATLCRKHDLDRVDLLVIDTEGHDAAILDTIDWEAQRPLLVVYEHYHLAREERESCRAGMEGRGYAVLEEGFDTWCLSAGADAGLAREWRAALPVVPGVSIHDETA